MSLELVITIKMTTKITITTAIINSIVLTVTVAIIVRWFRGSMLPLRVRG